MDVIWRNGNSGSDLYIDVILDTPGAGGGYTLQKFEPATGVYSPIGDRTDNPPKPSQPTFRIKAADLTDNPLSLRLKVTLGNPAQVTMPVALQVRQGDPLAPEDPGTGKPAHYPAPMPTDAPQNATQDYDFQVWFA